MTQRRVFTRSKNLPFSSFLYVVRGAGHDWTHDGFGFVFNNSRRNLDTPKSKLRRLLAKYLA